jgi:hypothetical protein
MLLSMPLASPPIGRPLPQHRAAFGRIAGDARTCRWLSWVANDPEPTFSYVSVTVQRKLIGELSG